MTITHDFEYFKPAHPDEVIQLMDKYGSLTRILAGGTDLSVNLKENLITAAALIDIKGVSGIDRLEFDGANLFVGAAVTFNRLIAFKAVQQHFPVIVEAVKTVGSHGLRNRATMTGNICSAVPCLDSAAFLLLYEAIVNIYTRNGSRTVPMSEWFIAPRKTVLNPGEFVTGITIPKPDRNNAGCYVKLKRLRGEDLAQAGAGVLILEGLEYRIAFSSVGPVPKRAPSIEALLKGKPLDEEIIEKAKKLVPDETSPITDLRATKEYRAHMSGVMLGRSLNAASARLNGNGPAYGTPLL